MTTNSRARKRDVEAGGDLPDHDRSPAYRTFRSPQADIPTLLTGLQLDDVVDVDALTERRQSYQCVHLGTRDLPIAAMKRALAPVSGVPRTGHLGDWGDIALGRAGAMDFNRTICSQGLGFPLIYAFTQTETIDPAHGDQVYLPGSIVRNGTRRLLELYTWDGAAFVRRSRDTPWFCPFVKTELDGRLVPLVALHRARMQRLDEWSFTFEATLLAERPDIVRTVMATLLEAAGAADNARAMFRDLIGHAVTHDGRATPCEIRRDGNAYWIDDVRYASLDALIDGLMTPMLAVTDPELFFALLPSLPARIPVMANTVARLLVATILAPTRQTSGFVLHAHWGARDMAGFPPRRKGYFTARSKTRSLRILCDELVRTIPSFDPICVALLPAAVLMLCPTSAHPRDGELLADLFGRVRRVPIDQDLRDPLAMAQPVEEATETWWHVRANALSPYFRNRFAPGRGVIHRGLLPERSDPVEPDGFTALTLQQGCMIVGALARLAATP